MHVYSIVVSAQISDGPPKPNIPETELLIVPPNLLPQLPIPLSMARPFFQLLKPKPSSCHQLPSLTSHIQSVSKTFQFYLRNTHRFPMLFTHSIIITRIQTTTVSKILFPNSYNPLLRWQQVRFL